MKELNNIEEVRAAIVTAEAAFEKANDKYPDYLYLGKNEFFMALGNRSGWTVGESTGTKKYLGLEVVPVPRDNHVAVS